MVRSDVLTPSLSFLTRGAPREAEVTHQITPATNLTALAAGIAASTEINHLVDVARGARAIFIFWAWHLSNWASCFRKLHPTVRLPRLFEQEHLVRRCHRQWNWL